MSTKATGFLRTNQDGLKEYRISNKGWQTSPKFFPEIRSGEDLQALLPHMDALDDENPIVVPGHKWPAIHTQPKFSKYAQAKRSLLQDHPLIYYEPPELFRYTMPDRLVTYALQGSQSRRAEFNEEFRAGNIGAAIEKLPQFFRPFMARQRKSLLGKDEEAPDRSYVSGSSGSVTDGWSDQRADQGFQDYFRGVIENAKEAQHAKVVPPVPPVTKSSRDTEIRRMRGANRAMLDLCEAAYYGFNNPIFPYYHIYADTNILRSSTNNDSQLIDALEKDLDTLGGSDIGFAGVAVTFSQYEKAWEEDLDGRLEQFVDRVSSIAERFEMPLMLPRSGWYGVHLSDHGAHIFTSMMNGHTRYKSKGGGAGERYHLYGKTPLYQHAVEKSLDQFDQILQNKGGSVHPINGLPDSPPKYNPRGSSYKEKYGSPREYRIKFGKPRRLLHAQEARELRKGIKQGLMRPAKRYLERSEHGDLAQ